MLLVPRRQEKAEFKTSAYLSEVAHKLIGAMGNILGVLYGLLFGIKMAYFKS